MTTRRRAAILAATLIMRMPIVPDVEESTGCSHNLEGAFVSVCRSGLNTISVRSVWRARL
jgi:hypothetical protein